MMAQMSRPDNGPAASAPREARARIWDQHQSSGRCPGYWAPLGFPRCATTPSQRQIELPRGQVRTVACSQACRISQCTQV